MQIAKGLRAAHGNGIIHRDMKPENIFLIQREGRPDFVKVLDFGIAKIINADEMGGPALTQTGMIFGTPEYMSPEQAQGSPPDHRVDIYAVGCIMYHMLTGHVPFTADNFMGILTKHLLEAPVPPRKRRPDLEIMPDVEAICLKAMEKDRDKRFADMDAFYRALGAAGGFAFEPSAVFVAPRVPKASLKYPTLAAANVEARESRTAIASSSGRGRSRTNGRGGSTTRPAASAARRRSRWSSAGLALGVGGVVFALKPSSTVTPPPRSRRSRRPPRRPRLPRPRPAAPDTGRRRPRSRPRRPRRRSRPRRRRRPATPPSRAARAVAAPRRKRNRSPIRCTGRFRCRPKCRADIKPFPTN